ncbi:Flp family type IVb pilin [Blastopirellula marina]|uniref:Flp family type IVb pilin n=1 Tax=Blastopirellula marina TaxID=124 RepID=A0A2S8GG62_9BACT|nr:Flp family type IVb pilin [Blastopirellula marina]PQO43280.1 Flp family type IVb pilin [Blastopirellula marina]
MSHLIHFLLSEDGPTAVEYAVMLAVILVVCLTAIGFMGQQVGAGYQHATDEFARTFPSSITP